MININKVYKQLGSKKLALYLFIGLTIVFIPKTLISQPIKYLDFTLQAVLGLLAVNLTFCTVQRFNSLRKATLFIHIGMIAALAGGLVSAFGYVATVNIHEGSSTDTVYRWDIEEDIPLGYELQIKKIRREFYPIPVQVGVLDRGEKAGLFTLKTGESFDWQTHRVLADFLDLENESLRLKVFDEGNKLVGSYSTSGESDLPDGFPLEFKLVSYRDPVLKNIGVDLVLKDNGKVLAEGFTKVNDPFKWQGLKFHITNVAIDQYGLPYAGIQIVKDQGVYLAYLGFIVICIGCVLRLLSMNEKRAK